jgi:hypothetical protein
VCRRSGRRGLTARSSSREDGDPEAGGSYETREDAGSGASAPGRGACAAPGARHGTAPHRSDWRVDAASPCGSGGQARSDPGRPRRGDRVQLTRGYSNNPHWKSLGLTTEREVTRRGSGLVVIVVAIAPRDPEVRPGEGGPVVRAGSHRGAGASWARRATPCHGPGRGQATSSPRGVTSHARRVPSERGDAGSWRRGRRCARSIPRAPG